MSHRMRSLVQHVSYDVPDAPMDLAIVTELLFEKTQLKELTSPISANDLGSVIRMRSSSLMGCDMQLTMGSSMEEVEMIVDVVL